MHKLRLLILILILAAAQSAMAANILLIASSYHKGTGPFTSTIQTPLVTAGHTVRVWDQFSQGWPPMDTLWAYNAVFFHGSERRATGPIDSMLTLFAQQGGRLVTEGSNIASYGGAYSEFEQHVMHADWQRAKQTLYTHQVVNASHPIAAGLPATFTASGYAGGSQPDKSVVAHGGTLVIQFQNQPGTVAVSAAPRQAFVCGSLQRVQTSTNVRNTLITNLVNWVLQNPDDAGIIDMGYSLGTSVGQSCPVWVKVRNFATTSDSGNVVLQVSTDSTNWGNVDTTRYVLASSASDSLLFAWTPLVESRYYLRAVMQPEGIDSDADNNSAGFIVTTFDETVHPRLFFTAAEIPTLQQQATTTHLAMYQQLNTRIAQNLSYVPPVPANWESVNYSTVAGIIAIGAFKAVLTPTPTYINHAKNNALALCRYPHWEPGITDMDIYSGRCVFALSLAYDWLYPYWTKAERDTIQTRLREQMQRLAAAEPRWVWWPDAYIHNHNINCMSYLGSAAFGMMEEEPEAQIWEQMAINNLDNIMALYGDVNDGSWYEAMNYWGFITWTMLPHLWLLREQQNTDYFDTPFVQSMAKYRIYASMPEPQKMPMINEAQPDEWYGPDDQLGLFAREYNNTEAQWLRQRVASRMGYSWDGPCGWFFYDPNVAQTVPTDLSWVATDQDTYYGRSAWNDTTSTYVTLKCGLVGGRHAYTTYWGQGAVGGWEPSHFLPEQNAFTLAYGPDYIVQSAGLQSPYHRTYNSTTMLVNGAGQIGDSTKGSWTLPNNELEMNPSLIDTFFLKHTDYVVGDATTSYPSTLGLTRYRRHMLYVRPDFLVVLDDMRATTPSTFTFIIRNPSPIYLDEGDHIFINGNWTDSDMHILSPAAVTKSLSFNNYYNSQWGGWGQRVSNATPDTSVRFVNVFYPRQPNVSDASLLFGDRNLTVLRLYDQANYEITAAISHGNTNAVDVDSLWSNASLTVVVRNPATSDFTYGAVRQGSLVDWGTPARHVFESPTPVDMEWTIEGDTLRIDGAVGDWARFWAPTTVFVWLNGQAEPYFQNGPFIEIGNLENVPNGRINDLVIKLGDDGALVLRWSTPTFYINGVSTPPDSFDIYAADQVEGPFSVIATVAGGEQRYDDYDGLDQRFYYVIARLSSPLAGSETVLPKDEEASQGAPSTAAERHKLIR